MAFCPHCGAQATGAFCGSCGKSMGDAAAPAGGPAPAGGGPAVAASGMTENVAGGLCYVLGLLTGILFLVLEPYNRNPRVRFHAFQSIFLNVAWIGVWILLTAVGAMMHFLALLLLPIWMVLGLGFFVLWVMLLIKTFNGGKMVLPIIGPMAQQQAGGG